MSQKTVLIAFLDKSWPPHHSFVDGMLVDVVARQRNVKVRLCVSRAVADDVQPRSYRGAACIPELHARRASGRVRNLWKALGMIWYQAARERKRGNRVVLFVRNDPVYLLAASVMRRQISWLVFQSSFPHEEYSGHVVKRRLAKLIHRIAGGSVDAITGVTPEGVARVQRLCPSAKVRACIPLLTDLPVVIDGAKQKISPELGPVFVYIGAHQPERELETVLAGVVRAVQRGAVARFRFIGATKSDEERLRKVKGVDDLIARDLVRFTRPVSRQVVPTILSECDIGLSLIPPKPIYYESSPTKLAEYMGSGLAVLANRGIPMQERFVQESSGGLLVDWSVEAISTGIQELCEDYGFIAASRDNSATFATKVLQYRLYLPQFCRLLAGC